MLGLGVVGDAVPVVTQQQTAASNTATARAVPASAWLVALLCGGVCADQLWPKTIAAAAASARALMASHSSRARKREARKAAGWWWGRGAVWGGDGVVLTQYL